MYNSLDKFQLISFILIRTTLKDENQQSLPKFLAGYKDYGGVVLNWMLFGSSGHVKRPEGKLCTQVDNETCCLDFEIFYLNNRVRNSTLAF